MERRKEEEIAGIERRHAETVMALKRIHSEEINAIKERTRDGAVLDQLAGQLKVCLSSHDFLLKSAYCTCTKMITLQ